MFKNTRAEAVAACTSETYVEFYGGRWVVVPLALVVQPAFFNCIPGKIGGAL